MDVIIQANLQSPLLSTLSKNLSTDLSYKISKNMPNSSKQIFEITPNISSLSTPASKELLFKVPRYFMLTDMMIKSRLVSALNTESADNGNSALNSQQVGLNLFETIELRSSNRVICSNSDAYLRVRVDASPFGKGLGASRRAMCFSSDGCTVATAWASDAEVIVYTPLFFSFFENIQSSLDLSFVEELTLRVVFNTLARSGLNGALSTAVCTLFCYGFNLESDELAKLRARNFKVDQPLSMLSYDQYIETGTLTSGATSSTFNINCKNPVFATHIFFRNNAAGGEAIPFVMKDVTVKFAGKTLYDTVPVHVMNWDKCKSGSAGLIRFDRNTQPSGVLETAIRPLSIYWGLEPENRTYNSGAVSFGNTNNPQVIITHLDPSTTTDYYIVHEYHQIVSIENNGRVSVAMSM